MSAPGSFAHVIGGDLRTGLSARITSPSAVVQEGSFVVIEHGDNLDFGIVTNLSLGSTHPDFAEKITDHLAPGLARPLRDATLFADAEILNVLSMDTGPDPGSPEHAHWREEIESGERPAPRPRPVKALPPHHSPVRLASAGDIAEVFGKPKPPNFVIGHTREQGHPVCINLERLVQRSSGIFGATGTGKSFLARIVLAGLVKQSSAASLILDMHNEYAYDDTATDSGKRVAGLKSKFPSKVAVVGLGRGAQIRGQAPDFHIEVPLRDIRPEDLYLLTEELNLKETTPATVEALVESFGPSWLVSFSKMEVGATIPDPDDDKRQIPAPHSVAHWARKAGVNTMAAEGLHGKLTRLFRKPYVVEAPSIDAFDEVVKLLMAGKHVILSFGRFESDLDYLLVSNVLTRKIRDAWVEATDGFRSSGSHEPRPLAIVVEEAHKLLSPSMARQTAFGTIAREMRKYYVTLLIIDQRPSKIYDEVMSQLGSRLSGWLGDEDDIRAVLSGLSSREMLRGMLARLEPRAEALLLGTAVPMPLPIKTRRYDDRFWAELLGRESSSSRNQPPDQNERLAELGF
jgi:DNA helicase HerA-like ATPase